jgi:hypothetical protein
VVAPNIDWSGNVKKAPATVREYELNCNLIAKSIGNLKGMAQVMCIPSFIELTSAYGTVVP